MIKLLSSDDFHVKLGSPCSITTGLGGTLGMLVLIVLGFNMFA